MARQSSDSQSQPFDTMRAIFGAMIWRFYKDTGKPDQGFDWLRKLDANVKEYTADGTLLMQKLGRREGLHAVGHAGRSAIQRTEEPSGRLCCPRVERR